jgi:predicted HicB family RNase H-like nuclease
MTSIADGVHSEIVCVRIAQNVSEALRKAAAERDSSVSDVIREAIKALPPAA